MKSQERDIFSSTHILVSQQTDLALTWNMQRMYQWAWATECITEIPFIYLKSRCHGEACTTKEAESEWVKRKDSYWSESLGKVTTWCHESIHRGPARVFLGTLFLGTLLGSNILHRLDSSHDLLCSSEMELESQWQAMQRGCSSEQVIWLRLQRELCHSCFHALVHVTSEKEDELDDSWLQINQVTVSAF